MTVDAASLLDASGPVAGALDGFRPRAEQRRMAAAVEEALARRRHLVVEAGTGVGKSFAYLVPALLHVARGGGPVVVATRTIALQEQLVGKDIPFLLEALDLDVPVALAKGRGNYVCLRRLEMAHAEQGGLFPQPEQREQVNRIHAWGRTSEDGSLADLPFAPLPEVWDAVRAEQGNCLHKRCEFYARCGYQRSRREIQSAALLVANHALVFSDLALREAGGRYLPDYDAIVLDEAHAIEEGAAEHFGIHVGLFSVTRQLARLTGSRRAGGLFGRVGGTRALAEAAAEVRDAAEETFRAVAKYRGKDPERRIREPGAFFDSLTEPLAGFVAALRKRHAEIEDPGVALEWKARADRLDEIGASVRLVHGVADPDLVYWVEAAGRREHSVLRAAPIDVAPILRRTLLAGGRAVVMTSATLSVGGSFEHFERGVGLEAPDELRLGSPFDFGRQCRLLLFPSMPDPRDASYDDAVAARVRELVLESGGGAFVLFTSYRSLQRVHDSLSEPLASAGLHVLRQGGDLRPRDILETFRERRDCVLFATDTFWQGVDVRGENLRLVILTKLPFAVPDHPLQQARFERLEAEGGDPFRRISLPQAVLRLRQGFGRLIRTHDDHGTVAILDPRVLTKAYGKTFLASLPECRVERR
jgi:ATP-dependent DNA helicase DinG